MLFLQTYGRAEGKRRRFYEPLPSYVKNYAKGVDPCQAPDAARRVFNIQNGLKASFIFAAKSPAANRRVLHANERSLVTMSVRRQGFRDNGLGKLREALAHRIGEVRRPAVGAASGG